MKLDYIEIKILETMRGKAFVPGRNCTSEVLGSDWRSLPSYIFDNR